VLGGAIREYYLAGPNVWYLTGLASSSAALLLPADGDRALLATDSRYSGATRPADLELLEEWVVVRVDHARRRVNAPRHLVHVIAGRKPGVDVEEPPDARFPARKPTARPRKGRFSRGPVTADGVPAIHLSAASRSAAKWFFPPR
jgi:hypothetical protein